MAPRAVACPKCKTKLTVPEGAARFRCPRCKTVLTAPSPPRPQAPARPQSPSPQPAPQAPPPPLPSPRVPPPEPSPQARLLEPQDSLAGQELGGYRITRLIGRGGMGTVYEAIQEGLKRRVALKVLPPTVAQDTAFLTAFKREAQAAAKLNHPNIVQIFDIVESGGHHFFSMEFVDGEGLGDRLRREGRLPVVDALQVVAQVAGALDHANEHMLIHRDIKPSNILLTQRGDVKLADLGLSKSLEETAVGVVRGTHGGPVYMAPEFAQNPQIADCRSDIYALGAVLYQLLTGQPPFPGPTVADLIKQHAHSPLPSARGIVPELPEDIETLLQKMCAKDPAERFQTHGELLGRVHFLLKATAVRQPRVPAAPSPGATSRPRRRWLPFAIGAAVVVAVAAVAAVLLLPRLRGTRPKAAAAPATDTAVEPAPPPAPKQGEPTTAPGTDTSSEVVPTPPDEPEPEPPDEKAPPKENPDKPDQPQPPDEQEPKEPGEKDPPEQKPDKPDEPAAWEPALAAAADRADELAKARQFGQAIAALEALLKDDDDEALKTRVAEATEAIEVQAAQAYAAVRNSAVSLAGKGKLAEAAAALKSVVDTFGTEQEVKLAQATIAALSRYGRARASLAGLSKQAADGARAAQRRATALAKFAEAIGPIDTLAAGWQFDQATRQLSALEADEPAVAQLVAQRKAAVAALAGLRGRMIQLINTAKPRLRKSDLRIRGLNGDLVRADAEAITIQTPMKAETLPWAKLRDVSAKALAQRTAKPTSGTDQLAIGTLLLRCYDDADGAMPHLERARALGAKIGALGDPTQAAEAAELEAQAAQALAAAVGLLARGQHTKAAAALASYRKQFAETDYFASAKKLHDTAARFKPFKPPTAPKPPATPTKPSPKKPPPKKPKPKPKPRPPAAKVDPKAQALYRKAAAAYAARRLDQCAKLLDELKATFPKSPLLTNARLKPSVAAMRKAIATQGDTLTVSRSGPHKSLADALGALKKPNSVVQIEPSRSPYRGGAVLSGDHAHGTVVRAAGDKNPCLDGGPAGKAIVQIFPDTRNVVIDGLTFQRTRSGVAIDERCSVAIRNCFGLKDVVAALTIAPESTVAISDSVLKINTLNAATAQDCAFLCGDTTIDYSRLTRCVLRGTDIGILGSTLTDCLIIGSVRIRDRATLNHVTITKTVTIERDIRGARLANCILPNLEFDKIDLKEWKRKTKEQKQDEALNVSLTNCLLFRHRDPLPDTIVKAQDTEPLARGNPGFRAPERGDFTLAEASPYRGKAADKSDLGCRLPPDTLKLLRYLAR